LLHPFIPRQEKQMKARKLIDGASFGPEALKVISEAFDRAWSEIGANFGTDPEDINRARLSLADAVLSIATENSRDVAALKRGALEAMALNYRKRFRSSLGWTTDDSVA
jgi:hypothetical protein